MDEQTLWVIAATALAVFFGTLVRTVSGFGFSLAAVPLLALVWAPPQAVAIAILFQTASALYGVARQHRHVDWRLLGGVCIGAPLGLIPGLMCLQSLPETTLRLTLASLILLSAGAIMSGARLPGPITRWRLLWVGAASGFTQGLAGAAGPPLMATLLASPSLSAATIRATATAVFLVFGLASLLYLGVGGALSGLTPMEYAIVGTGMLAGYVAGDRLFRLASEQTFRQLSLLLMVISAVLMVVPLW